MPRTSMTRAAHVKVAPQRASHMRVGDPAEASTHDQDSEMFTAKSSEQAAEREIFGDVELSESSSLHENGRADPGELSDVDESSDSRVQTAGDLYSLDELLEDF